MIMQYSAFGLYMIVMFAIGLHFYFRTDSISDFVLGGRTLGPIPSAISSVASDFSGWLLMGLPAFAMTGGMGAFWIALGLLLGTFANWTFVAPKLRQESFDLDDAVTVPTFLERKLKDPTNFLRVVLSLAILFFFAFYTASGFVAGGKLFEVLFGLDYHIAITVGALVVLSYTFLGGYLAVSWTDVIQGMLMIAALIFIPVVAIQFMGGWDETFATLKELSPHQLGFFHGPVNKVVEGSLNINVETAGKAISILTIVSLMAWGLGYFGQPHILVRMMGINSVTEVKKARWIATGWSFIAMSMALLVGFIGVVYFQDHQIADAEYVFILMVQGLTHPLVGGLLLAAIMAAIMSTADSQLLVASSALTSDLVRDKISEKQSLQLGRLTVVVVALAALFLAWDENSKVLDIVSYAWAGLGSSIGAVMLVSLTWPKATYQGGIAGVLVGAFVTVGWNYLSGGWMNMFDLYELLPAFVLAALAVFVVSSMTQPKEVA
ncbi:sodium/proline symporter PutP [Suttonella sp. R2A3]|uniref:sodium/proline symporter PutP n=1 Tax=Suttonella sp. R2A3 TaxID=2908648 RepID=UPI001F3A84F6|nr:sodium/proline symporter PutP [Suttonella sp. R2A3]UJF25248.1 sodium/proline symporter PutP [Suttonella sp. R2A3]